MSTANQGVFQIAFSCSITPLRPVRLDLRILGSNAISVFESLMQVSGKARIEIPENDKKENTEASWCLLFSK